MLDRDPETGYVDDHRDEDYVPDPDPPLCAACNAEEVGAGTRDYCDACHALYLEYCACCDRDAFNFGGLLVPQHPDDVETCLCEICAAELFGLRANELEHWREDQRAYQDERGFNDQGEAILLAHRDGKLDPERSKAIEQATAQGLGALRFVRVVEHRALQGPDEPDDIPTYF